MFERILRKANSFAEVEGLDREDISRLTLEARISAVEQLRRTWFGEHRTQSRLDRVLVATDLETLRFVLVGGHAVAAHAEPRLTEDLDVFVEPTLANATRLRDALSDLRDVAILESIRSRPAKRRRGRRPRR